MGRCFSEEKCVNSTDADLVLAARAGDAEAFGQLAERHAAMVHRVALTMVPRDAAHRHRASAAGHCAGRERHGDCHFTRAGRGSGAGACPDDGKHEQRSGYVDRFMTEPAALS